jgi:hypothetical protein
MRPDGVVRSTAPVVAVSTAAPFRSTIVTNSSSSTGERCRRSGCQATTASMRPAVEVLEQPRVLRPLLAAVCGDVVVDIDAGELPASLLDEPLTVLPLALDAEHRASRS